jgi:hypothetical protein
MVLEGTRLGKGASARVGLPADAGLAVGSPASGVCKRFDAAALARSPGAAEQAGQQVFDILARGLDLSVTIGLAGDSADACAALSATCELLAGVAGDAGTAPARIEIVIDDPVIMPACAEAIRRDFLGAGVVHVVAGGNRLRAARNGDGERGSFWQQLWRARTGEVLRVAYAAQLRATSPLLRSEPATAVLPVAHIEVPADTAWTLLRVDLSDFRSGGGLCELSLEAALRERVEQGERRHDRAVWATPQMRDDAWLNRRLAIAIEGIGDFVVRQGMDPTAFSTLECLGHLLQSARNVVRAHSRLVAERTGYLPALEQTDPSRFLPPGEMHDAWRRRWTELLSTAAVRHRNLLAISPWSVFPTDQRADFRFADLLPVLRYADACMLSGVPDLQNWRLDEFSEFHCRASAALQQRVPRHQIAEGC